MIIYVVGFIFVRRELYSRTIHNNLSPYITFTVHTAYSTTQVQAAIQAVENTVFADFSAKLGIANIREYESAASKRHQGLLAQQQSIAKQIAELSAQLQYELKKDFLGTLSRITTSTAEANAEYTALNNTEQTLLHSEISTRAELKAAQDQVHALQQTKNTTHAALKNTQGRRAELLSDRDAVSKKVNDLEIMVERYRTSLHDILQKARVDEVALPTITSTDSSSNNADTAVVMDTLHDSDSSSSRRHSTSSHNTNNTNNSSRDDLYWEGTDSNSRRGEYSVMCCVLRCRMITHLPNLLLNLIPCLYAIHNTNYTNPPHSTPFITITLQRARQPLPPQRRAARTSARPTMQWCCATPAWPPEWTCPACAASTRVSRVYQLTVSFVKLTLYTYPCNTRRPHEGARGRDGAQLQGQHRRDHRHAREDTGTTTATHYQLLLHAVYCVVLVFATTTTTTTSTIIILIIITISIILCATTVPMHFVLTGVTLLF